MTTALLPIGFSFEGSTVRVVDHNGESWFVARDVCKILGIGNPSDAIGRLDDDESSLVSIEGSYNSLPLACVNEPGLYALILGSRKPEAKAFRRWVTHEVLPTIRRTGAYSVAPSAPSAPALPQDYEEALVALVGEVRERKRLAAETARLTLKAAEDAPKVAFFDQVTDSTDAISFNDAAKLLGIGQKKLMAMCRAAGILDRRNVAYQRYLDAEYFRIVLGSYTDTHGEAHVTRTTRVYQRGLEFLRRKFAEVQDAKG